MELKVHCAYDEMVEISKVKPNPNNPNMHPENQIEMLAKIIEAQGWRAPITVSKLSGLVVRGHGRLEAAEYLGLDKVPVDYQDYESEEMEYADLLADNRIAELADIDMEKLAEILQDYDFENIELTGYTEDEVSEILSGIDLDMEEDIDMDEADDNVPTVPTFNFTQKGDVWEIGRHRLICGDSTEESTYNWLMKKETADLIVTDPPYNVDYEGTAGKIQNDKMEDSKFALFLQNAFCQMAEHIKPGGGVYVFHADSEGLNFRREFVNAGFLLNQCLVWVKNTFALGRQDYQWRHEPILYGWKEGAAHYFTESRKKSTVLEEFQRPKFESMGKEALVEFLERIYDGFDELPQTTIYHNKPTVNKEHPTMKPVKLVAELIQNSSKPGEIVLDPFGGSGSTLIACEATKRKARIIELDEKFCDVIVKRYAELTNKKDITLVRKGERIKYEDTDLWEE